MKLGKHSVRVLECLFAACSVRLLLGTDLLVKSISGPWEGADLRTQEHERS